MRTMNLLMGIVSLLGIAGVIFGGAMFAEVVKNVCGKLACDVTVLVGFILIGLNGINAGICIPKALLGTDKEQW